MGIYWDRVEDQQDVIIEQLTYGLLDFEEAVDLYGDEEAFLAHLLTNEEWGLEGILGNNLNKFNLMDKTKNIVLDSYKKYEDFDILCYLPSKLQHDKEVVMAAVSSNAWELEAASKGFKDDKEVVMTAGLS